MQANIVQQLSPFAISVTNVNEYTNRNNWMPRPVPRNKIQIKERREDVLVLLTRGMKGYEIAKELGIYSLRTTWVYLALSTLFIIVFIIYHGVFTKEGSEWRLRLHEADYILKEELSIRQWYWNLRTSPQEVLQDFNPPSNLLTL